MAEIVLFIEQVGDELEMRLESEAGSAEQRERRKAKKIGKKESRSREIKERKKERKNHSGGRHSEHDDAHGSGPHETIILLESANDTVIFKSAEKFIVDVTYDPELVAPHEPQPRRTPFEGWDLPQVAQQSGNIWTVTGKFKNEKRKERINGQEIGSDIDNTKPTDQGFYKCTVWCANLILDPDMYCDR